MIQKLTANLKQSELYGERICAEITAIANEIVKTKVEIAQLEGKLGESMKERDHVEVSLKKQSEEQSGYEYKYQKLEIRLKEYNRKLVLQQEIHTKKISQQESLRNKINQIESDISSKDILNGQISKLQTETEDADLKISKQVIALENLYTELISNNKIVRKKQDELQLVKKSNAKKIQWLKHLDQQLKNTQNKENETGNLAEEQKLTNLAILKERASRRYFRQLNDMIGLVDQVDEVLQLGINIKKQISKQLEIAQEIKNQKQSLMRVKDTLGEVKLHE